MSRRNLRDSSSESTTGAAVTARTRSNGGEKAAFSNQLLVAMLSFQNGDFAVRLPSDLTGLEEVSGILCK
jgi:hypothetical protein